MGKVENPSGEAAIEDVRKPPPRQPIANPRPEYAQQPAPIARPTQRPSSNQNRE